MDKRKNLRQTPETFWAQVQKGEPANCWLWTGEWLVKGYGRVGYGRTEWYAHRLAWHLTNGPIPQGMVVCHRCDNPLCVNPAHLFIGSQSDNIRDMWAKGRENPGSGERHGHAKLSDCDVRGVFSEYWGGGDRSAIAAKYSITPEYVSQIGARKTRRVATAEIAHIGQGRRPHWRALRSSV